MQSNYNMPRQQLPTTDQQRDLGIITKDLKWQKQTEKQQNSELFQEQIGQTLGRKSPKCLSYWQQSLMIATSTIQVCTNSRWPAFRCKWTQRSVLLLLLLLITEDHGRSQFLENFVNSPTKYTLTVKEIYSECIGKFL